MQQSDETLEDFFSRLRELGAHCRFEQREEDLIKDIFISIMISANIHMELLSEVQTPQQAFSYAVNRERGQANQQEILKTKPHTFDKINQDHKLQTLNKNSQLAGKAETHF